MGPRFYSCFFFSKRGLVLAHTHSSHLQYPMDHFRPVSPEGDTGWITHITKLSYAQYTRGTRVLGSRVRMWASERAKKHREEALRVRTLTFWKTHFWARDSHNGDSSFCSSLSFCRIILSSNSLLQYRVYYHCIALRPNSGLSCVDLFLLGVNLQ